MEKQWTELTNGYQQQLDQKLHLCYQKHQRFKLGKYKVSVWVKKAGTEGVKSNASGLGNYDNYYTVEIKLCK